MTDHYFDTLMDRVQSAKTVITKSEPCACEAPPQNTGFSAKVDEPLRENVQSFRRAVEEAKTAKVNDRQPRTMNALVLEATLNHLNSSIEDGRVAFRNLTLLNSAMFGIGLLLMLFAGLVGLFFGREMLTLILGGLGIAGIGVVILMRPKEDIQKALSNQMQAQTVFLDFYNQLQYWAPDASQAASLEEKRQTSQAMHDATSFALKSIQEYVEPGLKGRQ